MKTTYPVEVRRSAWEIWTPFAFAVGAVGVALHRILHPAFATQSDVSHLIFFVSAAGLFAAFLFVRSERYILHADRIERIDLLRRMVRPRDEVTGYRVAEGQVVVFGPTGGWRLLIPARVFKNPAWRAWIESCRNLNAEDGAEALKAAECDPSLGHNVSDRRQVIESRRRVTLAVMAAMTALFIWTMVWPRPSGLPVYLSGAAPFLALLLVAARRDLFGLFSSGQIATRVDLSMLIFGATAPALVAFALPLADWWQSVLCAALIGALTALVTVRFVAEAEHRHWLAGVCVGLAVFASSWGVLLTANQALDENPPMLVQAKVTNVYWSKGRPKLDVEMGGPRPFKMTNLAVSRDAYRAHVAGAPLCAGVYPGRFGWRSVRLVKCETIVRLPASPRL